MNRLLPGVLAALFFTGCPAPLPDDAGTASDPDVPAPAQEPLPIDEGPPDTGPGIPGDRYDVGTPQVVDLWVGPGGSDAMNDGTAMARPLATIEAAWDLTRDTSAHGYRINLLQGTITARPQPPMSDIPAGEIRLTTRMTATHEHPIIIQSADPMHRATIRGEPSVYQAAYVYFINVDVTLSDGDDVVHLDTCDHVLIRNCTLTGRYTGSQSQGVKEDIKVNNSQYVYVEDSELTAGWGNNLNYLAVQHGTLVNNRFHSSGEWCVALTGGTAYFRVEGNEVYDCALMGTSGGITVGQGAGFEYMTSPWVHYEAYDVKVVNNVVHNTGGPGLGVNGGYNILAEYNTLYRVAMLTDLGPSMVEVRAGLRGCDGRHGYCADQQAAGGWGLDAPETQYIPNRNVYIYNNIIYNPPDLVTRDQTFTVDGPVTPPAGSNVPAGSSADQNVRIRGNLIFDGGPQAPASHILGGSVGCSTPHPPGTCNRATLQRDNTINTMEPALVDPEHGDFHPQPGSLAMVPVIHPGRFDWSGLPTRPAAIPMGLLTNALLRTREAMPRTATSDRPGAY